MVVVGITAAITSTAFAQDKLAAIMVKPKLTKEDLAQIEAEVSERAKKLADAGSEKDRTKACEKIVAPVKTQGATKAALDAYAEACSSQFDALVTKDSFETAFDAVRVLLELENQNAASSLAAALKSRYPAIRFRAARGLHALHVKLKGDSDKCKTALHALGEAGASENDKIVLGAIYQAINFYSDVPDFQFGDECAQALNMVFAARVKLLSSGTFDEVVDEPGFDAAAASYGSASADEKAKLARHLAGLLSHAVDRYFAPDTADEYLPTLAGSIKKMEESLRAMIKASDKDAPGATISAAISSKGSLAKKQEPARAALQELLGVLKGDPWNVP
jgi:hypothetical protein